MSACIHGHIPWCGVCQQATHEKLQRRRSGYTPHADPRDAALREIADIVGGQYQGTELCITRMAEMVREALDQARAEEREACARVCDDEGGTWARFVGHQGEDGDGMRYCTIAATGCAKTIRVRGAP